MVGVWSFLIILRVAKVVAVAAAVVEVRTWSVMSVENLVILLENVACALAHEAWEVDDVEALALFDVGGVQTMGMGAGGLKGVVLLRFLYLALNVLKILSILINPKIWLRFHISNSNIVWCFGHEEKQMAHMFVLCNWY